MEKTLVIIKPDAVKKNLIGEIIKRIEEKGFKIIALKMIHLTKEQAKLFYIVHKDRDFYESLTDFMSSGPCVVMVVKGENVIEEIRDLMGATDPKKAKPNTIRADFGESIERNAIHGSDSVSSAEYEISCMFSKLEFCE